VRVKVCVNTASIFNSLIFHFPLHLAVFALVPSCSGNFNIHFSSCNFLAVMYMSFELLRKVVGLRFESFFGRFGCKKGLVT